MSKLPEKCSHGNPFGIGTKCPECDAIWKERMMSSDERLLQLSFDHLGEEYKKLSKENLQLRNLLSEGVEGFKHVLVATSDDKAVRDWQKRGRNLLNRIVQNDNQSGKEA